jgi:catechol 2,3-dioxygenase-like lactoylglutathione lyase family enzyme
MGRPTIRHLAIFTRDPDKVAEFYRTVFDMELLHKAEPTATEGKAYFLSDGHLTLAILPQRLEGEVAGGLNHFGFQVDSTEEITRRIVESGVEGPKRRPSTRPYAEHRGCDPEGNLFDISEKGYSRAASPAARDKSKAMEPVS